LAVTVQTNLLKTVTAQLEKAGTLATTGTDGAPDGGARFREEDRFAGRARRRTKWRKNSGLGCQYGANRGNDRQDPQGAQSGD